MTYVVNPTMDFPADGTVADHAYWLSGMKVRDGSGANPLGQVDARSQAFGEGDPKPSGTQAGGGALTGGTLPAISYTEQSQTWGATPATPKLDRLDIDAKNLATVTVNPARARLTCDVQLNVKTDGPLTVILAGCGRTARFSATNSCDASRPPRASISRHGLRATRGGALKVTGRAIAFNCRKGRAVPGKVKRVRIYISRRAAHGKCRFVQRNGRLSAPRKCGKPVLLNAKLGRVRRNKTPWSLTLKRIPRGTFALTASALDAKGHVQRASAKYNHKRFRIR